MPGHTAEWKLSSNSACVSHRSPHFGVSYSQMNARVHSKVNACLSHTTTCVSPPSSATALWSCEGESKEPQHISTRFYLLDRTDGRALRHQCHPRQMGGHGLGVWLLLSLHLSRLCLPVLCSFTSAANNIRTLIWFDPVEHISFEGSVLSEVLFEHIVRFLLGDR